MVGSPAFVILMSWGLVWLWERGARSRIRYSVFSSQRVTVNNQQSTVNDHQSTVSTPHTSRFTQQLLITIYYLLITALTAVALFGPLHSLYNYYTNPFFAKDDFRGLIQFVERGVGPNDAIVYNNAILLPLHEHYQTRTYTLVTASPTYPKQAHLVSATELTQVAASVDHIWFISDPPTDGRDRDGVAKQWLDEHLGLSGTYPFHARTTALNVVRYRTGSPYQTELPTSAIKLDQACLTL